jgi:hypothetical protein
MYKAASRAHPFLAPAISRAADVTMFRRLFNWGISSLGGHLALSALAVSLPVLLLGLIVNIRAGYPTADLGLLLMSATLAGVLPAFFVWHGLTARVQRLRKQSGAGADADAARPVVNTSECDAQLSDGAKIRYRWCYDAAYYSTVVDRYYKQLPHIRHPPIQYTLLWLGGAVLFSVLSGSPTLEFAGWALLIGAVGVPGLVVLTKQGIVLRYRLRPSFGTHADFLLSEAGITICQKSLHGTYPWTAYSRAVRFPDGILLLKSGAIRWLPDYALQSGTVNEAVTLVRSRMPIRLLQSK